MLIIRYANVKINYYLCDVANINTYKELRQFLKYKILNQSVYFKLLKITSKSQ